MTRVLAFAPLLVSLPFGFSPDTGVALAEVHEEAFDNRGNDGGWTFGAPNEEVVDQDGNEYLHAWNLDTGLPLAHTTEASLFTGDYRAMMVSAAGVTLRTFESEHGTAGRPVGIVLRSYNETPEDTRDDWAAYNLGGNMPSVSDGWRSYTFVVPTDEAVIPPGWRIMRIGDQAPANPDWNMLITSVDELGYVLGNPESPYDLGIWDLGIDNIRIEYAAPTGVTTSTWGEIRALYR